jgi:uncharacterized protein (DUF697 family)
MTATTEETDAEEMPADATPVTAGESNDHEVQRSKFANRIINAHAGYAAVGGLIPLPAIDVAASATVQVRMAAKLCELYELPFHEQAVKTTVAAFIASAVPKVGVGYSIFSLVKGVPVVGPLLGLATVPALNAALTWALGRVLMWHFARGGTLESLQSDEAMARFKQEFKDAKARFGAGDKVKASQTDEAETAATA